MKTLEGKQQRIFDALVKRAQENDGAVKIDNGGAFMPVCVEVIGHWQGQKIVSIAHYGKQNGDAMRDPDMTFLATEKGALAMTFQNDYLGKYEEAVTLTPNSKEFQVIIFKQQGMADLARIWMENLNEQQGLGVE